MNEEGQRYTYGYNIGWNVENEYVNNIKGMFKEYEAQKEVLKNIKKEQQIDKSVQSRFNELEEKDLRQTYDEFYSDSRISFEQFKKEYIEEKEKSNERLNNSILHNQIKYNANLYHLIDIKENLRRKINKEKEKLEFKLKQNEIDIKQQLLYFSYYKPNEGINLREKLNALYLENDKLKHALSELNQKYQEMQLTEEETAIRIKGLNPQESLYYNEITNNRKKNEDDVKKTSNPISDKPEEDDKKREKETEKYVFDEKLYENYENKLDEYHNELKEYEKDCSKISKMYEQTLIGELTLLEFEDFEKKMEQRYIEINEKYDSFVDYRNEILEKVKKGEIYHPSLKKEQCQILAQKFGITKPEGEKYEEYLSDIGLSNDYINEPRKPIDFHEVLNEVAEKYDNKSKDEELESIFDKINGDYKPSDKIDIAGSLNIIKYLNKEKFEKRKIIGIPMKLYRGVLGLSAKLSNIVSNINSKSRRRIEDSSSKIDELSNEELDFIYERMTSSDSIEEYEDSLSDPLWDRLLQRVFENNNKLIEKNSKSITTMYNVLLENYENMVSIYTKLEEDNSNEELKSDLFKYRDDTVEILRRLNSCYSEIDRLLNPEIKSDYLRGKWNSIAGKSIDAYLKNFDKLNEFNEKMQEKINEAASEDDVLKTIEFVVYKARANVDYFTNNKAEEHIENKETYLYESVHDEYLNRLEEWQSRGPLYKLLHRNEKPHEMDVALELVEGRFR